MSDIKEKVRELGKLSILSNRISDFHQKNMETYPFVVFNGIKEAEVDYGLERGGKNYVQYTLLLKNEAENPLLEKRLEMLDKSIKNLFWKEVSVIVILDGKKVFDSTPVETNNV